jgi:hypothetical protein
MLALLGSFGTKIALVNSRPSDRPPGTGGFQKHYHSIEQRVEGEIHHGIWLKDHLYRYGNHQLGGRCHGRL